MSVKDKKEFKLRKFQEKVTKYLLTGKSVILQAPTGSGKTGAALHAWLASRLAQLLIEDSQQNLATTLLPAKCIYAVPMRVLANQFEKEYNDKIAYFKANHVSLNKSQTPFKVAVQTGERAEDRDFQSDLIFTTIDQLLSNFLGVPYALSNTKANINCGAVISRLLILDEFHLFPVDEKNAFGAFSTCLIMLKWLKNLTPFVLMTATFSDAMLQTLASWLDAEIVTLSEDELSELESEQKKRYYHTSPESLTVEQVLDKHQSRSIVVFNNVKRAQLFYRQLKKQKQEEIKNGSIEIRLLHSRFSKEHRDKKEKWAMREFGKDTITRKAVSAILVATQVIEVGLDISCENLHTELAEATSIIQRGGRCARYQHETGNIYIYRPVDKNEKLAAQPYRNSVLEKAWTAFDNISGKQANYILEKRLVNTVHEEADKELLAKLTSSQAILERTIKDLMHATDDIAIRRNAARELIRQVYSTSIIIHHDPGNAGIEEPWKLEAFSLYTYSLQNEKRFQALLERAQAQDLTGSGLWYAYEEEDKTENARARRQVKWKEIATFKELRGQPLICVHPALAAYDEDIGFRFLVDEFTDEPSGNYEAPIPLAGEKEKAFMRFSYEQESYQEHIGKLLQAYKHTGQNRAISYQEEVARVAGRMEKQFGWEVGSIDRAIQLACACHDLGKMSEDWQNWAHSWQKKVGELTPATKMLAHTHYDPYNPLHKDIEKKYKAYNLPERPTHAVQGAAAATKLVNQLLGNEALARAVVTAIARHHSPDALQSDRFKLHSQTQLVMEEVLTSLEATLQVPLPLVTNWLEKAFPSINLALRRTIIRTTPQHEEILAYYLIVRVLRLCDVEALKVEANIL